MYGFLIFALRFPYLCYYVLFLLSINKLIQSVLVFDCNDNFEADHFPVISKVKLGIPVTHQATFIQLYPLCCFHSFFNMLYYYFYIQKIYEVVLNFSIFFTGRNNAHGCGKTATGLYPYDPGVLPIHLLGATTCYPKSRGPIDCREKAVAIGARSVYCKDLSTLARPEIYL